MSTTIILPLPPSDLKQGGAHAKADIATQERLVQWLDATVNSIRAACVEPVRVDLPDRTARDSESLSEELTAIFLHKSFNHQSRGRLSAVLPGFRQGLQSQIDAMRPLTLYFLYNGGYRASPFPQDPTPIFYPDQTELMLLRQISLLQARIKQKYAPGIDFIIVLNNGVAAYVNDISLEETSRYAKELRNIIESLGASRFIRVLLQSEVADFSSSQSKPGYRTLPKISQKEHSIVERFLGRPCSEQEASYRAWLYQIAETEWAKDLVPLVTRDHALLLRQVASSGMLSFRAFPGGAIRAQNGSLGFQEVDQTWVPKLISAETYNHYKIQTINWSLPLA
jgi:hypothetical protein